jgi:hypothetical protein
VPASRAPTPVLVQGELRVRRRPRSLTLAVRIHQPIRRRTGEYACQFEIQSRTAIRKARIDGVDGLQALLLTMRHVVVEIELILRSAKGRITGDPVWSDLQLLINPAYRRMLESPQPAAGRRVRGPR